MDEISTDQPRDCLDLQGQLSEIALFPAWIEYLASQHSIPSEVQFAINLCLEEAVSNIIRHGYGLAIRRPVSVHFTIPRAGYYVFVVEDEAPHFNPLDAPELPALNPSDEIRIGGQGIRLLRRFADTLEYERAPAGNRLRIGFSVAGSVSG